MKKALLTILVAALPFAAACGGAKAVEKPGSRATVTIDGAVYAVSDVKFAFRPGEHGYFRIAGDDARSVGGECQPGVRAGITLYGRLPDGVNSPAELSERELAFDFSGGGDQRNMCFVGSKGMLGVEKGTVKFGRVYGGAIAFTLAGEFKRSHAEGGAPESTVHASASGTAAIEQPASASPPSSF